jgi:hypothetical protein
MHRPSAPNVYVLTLVVATSIVAATVSVRNRLLRRALEGNLPPRESTWILVWTVSAVHFFLVFMMIAWLTAMPASYDAGVAVLLLGRFVSYVLPGCHGECVFNFLERRLLDPTYVYGSDPDIGFVFMELPWSVRKLICAAFYSVVPYTTFVVFRRLAPPRVALAATVCATLQDLSNTLNHLKHISTDSCTR